MIYIGPGFLSIVWFGSSPTLSPLSRQQARQAAHGKIKKERQLADAGGGGWGKERAKSDNGEKALSSVNHSTLSGYIGQI
jgi:hypothetical protein